MTGFGRGEARADGVAVVVELKSVNHRFLDLQVKAPREYLALEHELGTWLKERLHRGRVAVHVQRQARQASRPVVDDALLASWLQQLSRSTSELGLHASHDALVRLALTQPGVMSVEAEGADLDAERRLLERATRQALEQLEQMREVEGQALSQELEGQLATLESLQGEVSEACADLEQRLIARLRERMRRLVGDAPDEARLLQEAALQAEKADVREELVRLQTHIHQFRGLLSSSEAVGRRMEFLLQELNREINTLGSKTVDHAVSERVVDAKATLERMREQSANVE